MRSLRGALQKHPGSSPKPLRTPLEASGEPSGAVVIVTSPGNAPGRFPPPWARRRLPFSSKTDELSSLLHSGLKSGRKNVEKTLRAVAAPPSRLRAGALFFESWLPVYVWAAFLASRGRLGLDSSKLSSNLRASRGLLLPSAAFCGELDVELGGELAWELAARGVRWGIRTEFQWARAPVSAELSARACAGRCGIRCARVRR